MTGSVEDMAGCRVLVCDALGPVVANERDAIDLLGEAISADADWVAIPVARLDAAFFRLSTGLAGAVSQKFVNYGRRLAIMGEIPASTAGGPLADWVRESNRGRHVWFVASVEDLRVRLAR